MAGFTRGLLVAVCVMFSLSAAAAVGLPVNAARDAKEYAGNFPNSGVQSTKNGNDGNSYSSVDFSDWIAYIWTEARTFDFLLVEQVPNSVVGHYEVSIAKPGVSVPRLSGDGWEEDWVSLGVFGEGTLVPTNGNPSNAFAMNAFATNVYDPAQGTAGVRIDVYAYGNGTNPLHCKLREVWAFDGYAGNNMALQANFDPLDQDGNRLNAVWGNTDATKRFNDESMVWAQNYTAANSAYVYFTFDDAVTLDACIIAGGNGAANEYLRDFSIQYFNYTEGEWMNALEITGNTDLVFQRGFDRAGTSDLWRLYVALGNPSGGTRISEIMLFGEIPPIPEPATMGLLALGGLAVLRRRK